MNSHDVRMTPWHAPGPAIPRRGNALARAFARTILRMSGWEVAGELPDLPRFVIIAAPHTSNWDFVIGVLAKYAIGLRVSFLGKDTLFRPPLGWLMRWLGGQPVDRSSPHGVVEQTVDAMLAAPGFVLALAPEATRKRVTRWRTGFYQIAMGAGVPIVLAYFDFGRKRVGLGPMLWPSGDLGADLKRIGEFYAGVQGKRPELYGAPELEGQRAGGSEG